MLSMKNVGENARRDERGQAIGLLVIVMIVPLSIFLVSVRNTSVNTNTDAQALLAALDSARSASDAFGNTHIAALDPEAGWSEACAAMDRHIPFKIVDVALGSDNTVSVTVAAQRGDDAIITATATYTRHLLIPGGDEVADAGGTHRRSGRQLAEAVPACLNRSIDLNG